jgi:hypothetical protein
MRWQRLAAPIGGVDGYVPEGVGDIVRLQLGRGRVCVYRRCTGVSEVVGDIVRRLFVAVIGWRAMVKWRSMGIRGEMGRHVIRLRCEHQQRVGVWSIVLGGLVLVHRLEELKVDFFAREGQLGVLGVRGSVVGAVIGWGVGGSEGR